MFPARSFPHPPETIVAKNRPSRHLEDMEATTGPRLRQAEHAFGIDKVELGTLAYPELRLAHGL